MNKLADKMAELKTAITILAMVSVVLMLVLAVCRFLGIWTWLISWFVSTTEETAELTRIKGYYNANGYLVNSDSDINLDTTGNFQRFDVVDHELRVPMVAVSPMVPMSPNVFEPPVIPPQPLRLAPSPAPPIATFIPLPSHSHSRPQSHSRQPDTLGDKLDAEALDQMSANMSRAVSCDSVCSDTSVVVSDLTEPNVTGYLCVALEYDSESADLTVTVLEAKDLVGPDSSSDGYYLDTYVRVYLAPDKTTNLQTRIYKKTNCPSYNEKFMFGVESSEYTQRVLSFHVYASTSRSSTMIGEADLKLVDVSPRQPATTWLTLTDIAQRGTEFGELMFSLSYLPTAERLTVVVVKARNLKLPEGQESKESFVKVYLLQNGKKVNKKKTSTKKGERCPIFNEAMIFSVPCHALQSVHLRVTVAESYGTSKAYSIGHVIVGAQANGKALSHWNQMLSSLRKPIGMWHALRK